MAAKNSSMEKSDLCTVVSCCFGEEGIVNKVEEDAKRKIVHATENATENSVKVCSSDGGCMSGLANAKHAYLCGLTGCKQTNVLFGKSLFYFAPSSLSWTKYVTNVSTFDASFSGYVKGGQSKWGVDDTNNIPIIHQ